MILVRYLSRLFSLWTTWAFTAIELVAFILGASRANLTIPPVVYYSIAAIGFLIANVQLFSEAERKKQALSSEIEDLKATKANLLINVAEVVFIHDAPVLTLKDRYADGLNEEGLPIQAIIGANIEVQNTGVDEAQLEWEIDLKASALPEFFHLRPGNTQGQLDNLPDRFDGRRRWEGHWRLECGIHEKDPRAFALALAGAQSFQILMNYRTLRAGDPTPWRTTLIEGTLDHYRDSLAKRWRARGMEQLAALVSNTAAG